MWFRRKKRPDPDSALTETLRSLQTLLEDENSSNQRLEPTATQSIEDKSSAHPDFTFPDPVDKQDTEPAEGEDTANPKTGENRAQIPTAGTVDAEPHENEPTLTPLEEESTTESSNPVEMNDEAESDEKEAQDASEETDFWEDFPIKKKPEETLPWVDPFQNNDEPKLPEDLIVELQHEDIAQDDIVIPAIDTIPVLNNVVYVPPDTETDTQVTTPTVDLDQFIDVTVNSLRERIEQNNLSPMDSNQESTLRETLAQILSNKNTDRPQ